MYDKLVAKFNYVNTIGFILKTKYGIDKLNLEKKIIDGDKKKFLMLVDLLKKYIVIYYNII